MNLYSTIWRCIIILLNFSIKRCPLLPVGCQRFIGLGYLTVEPAPPFLIGSNLTVYCHFKNCEQELKMSLELNGKTVAPLKKVNCTTVMFHLHNVQTPQSIVRCKKKSGQLSKIVSGLDLQGGLPPDKPENIVCETTRSSDFIDCSWESGQETHLSTTYNVSVSRENMTQIHFNQTQDSEEITIPRGVLDKNTKYQLIVTAYNHFGASQSDPFILCVKDIVMPETPRIVWMEFGNGSIAATLQWKTTESSVHLRPYIRLRTHNDYWEVREETELREGLLRVDNLRPLTEYEFQIRTCNSTTGLTRARLNTGKSPSCSKWSPSVKGRSPGKGPTQQLHVWRMFSSNGTDGLRMLTVLWKPPRPEDYSGEVQHYKIFLANDPNLEVICPAPWSLWSVPVSAQVQAVSISAVTSYGSSPRADVPLRHSGVCGPVLTKLAPAASGSALLVSWSWPETKHTSTTGEDLLHYVVEWISVPATELQWQKLAKNQNSTSITGLAPGVRYNISLYAVTTRGVSAPSSVLIYSKEQKPVSSPNMSVLVHEARRLLIAWDELPVDQQRGFITNYTIYVQMLDSSKTALNVTVSGSGHRRIWLDCPDGALVLQIAASTSAGEGPRGIRISSLPAAPAGGLVIVIVFIITFFIAIIANLMCWSCVRQRIKQKCISWGPDWLLENPPKLGNSTAIRLLEDGTEPSFSSTQSDPPLSPITLISLEDSDNVYPNIHVEVFQTGSGQSTAETPLLTSDTGTMLVDSQLEHVSYRPQIAMLASQGEEETEEEQTNIPASGEEDACSSLSGGLLGGLLSSVEVDFSDSPLRPTLSSVGGLLWLKTPETTSVLNRGFLVGRVGTESEVEVVSPSLELQQGDIMTPDMADTCLSQYTVETALTGGYFPQVAAVSGTTLRDTER
ncbi:interleukin-23 receptor isoform X2 [Toxotes jaculatrix]|uniref:interleukin-23 receptor isoform X2 n=1 Tax=Toxotes jaculatrix TaxID=941984 RepID=UPI001B3A8443|nr:interleukin-23 receptor isoform X2 [Toxotes jaculatrix]